MEAARAADLLRRALELGKKQPALHSVSLCNVYKSVYEDSRLHLPAIVHAPTMDGGRIKGVMKVPCIRNV